ncbi:hypothetical protein [Enterobacter ludwigii]|uniref:hypothetical protein n=1 Tax=Enterobacter ludwigii TaxID=299767 RepID=UPI0006433520|nr:hypothetical protein [Enterobacter ludwigii]KLP39506.1 hypothetical protein ABR36_10875 [Enterobacter ludwigii]
MHSDNSYITIINTLLHTLHEVGFVAGAAEEYVSRDSEYAGAIVPHTLAVIQQRTEIALQTVGAIMRAEIYAAEKAVREAGGAENA